MRTLLIAATLVAAPTTVFAQTTPDGAHGFVAIGAGAAPEYDGADTYQAIPLVVADIERNGRSLEFRGTMARADLLTSDLLAAGPVINLRLPRDNDMGGRVALLDKVDLAVELGGFVGVRLGGDAKGQGQVALDVALTADVTGEHDGVLATASASYAALRSRQAWLNLDVQTTYGDKAFQRTYFGVTPREARASGLPAYRPGSGLRDAQVGATAGFQFNERWGVLGRVSYSRLLGDAADSPIVRDEGSRNQFLVGAAISYRF